MTAAPRRHRSQREELAVVIITSIAALATAWCAFQATVWSGVESFRLADTNDLRRRSVEARIEGSQVLALDAQQFIAWIEARARGEAQLTAFFFDRFRPELVRATREWLEADPFESPGALPHPFALDSYRIADFRRAYQLELEARAAHAEARAANHHADMYMLATVLLAAVLFVISSGPKETTHAVHRSFLSAALIGLLAVLAFVMVHPVRWSAEPAPPAPAPYERTGSLAD
jgi:hypothetical protein